MRIVVAHQTSWPRPVGRGFFRRGSMERRTFDGGRVNAAFHRAFSGAIANRTVSYPITRRRSSKTGANGWVRILRSRSARTSLRITKAYPTTESLSPLRVFGKPTGSRKARPFSAGGTASPRPSNIRRGERLRRFPHPASCIEIGFMAICWIPSASGTPRRQAQERGGVP
jgi:hypothetical protein